MVASGVGRVTNLWRTRRLRPALFTCSLLLALGWCPAHAQRAADGQVARKFDEVVIGAGGAETDVEARLLRFARQLKREPRTKAFVIAYSPRVRNRHGSDHWSIAGNRLLTTKAQLAGAYGVEEGRFIGVDGGIRERTTIELWVLPPGAKPPEPRAEFKPEDVIHCCVIRARGELYQYRKDEPLTFRADSALGSCPQVTAFRWSTSSGKIASGQGTNAITVDARATTDRSVTATVEAEGPSRECINTDSFETALGVAPYKLAEFAERYSEDLKIWGDYLSHYLGKEPQLRGHIIVYAGRNTRRGHAAARAAAARDYLINARGVAPERFTIVEGGYRESLMFEYWLVPEGMAPPAAAPWVDERYVRSRPAPKARARPKNDRRRAGI